MNYPLVSIILPVYNTEIFIEKCLKSLINQTYSNIEILVVNDGSCDNSLNIIKYFAEIDDRIKVYNQKNSGAASARNLALDKMHGDYVMFCDSDDFYEQNMVERMLGLIIRENVDFVVCNSFAQNCEYSKFESRKNFYENKYLKEGKFELTINTLLTMNIFLWNKILKADKIKKYNIRFPENIYSCEDNYFMYKYFMFSKSYYYLKEKLYYHSIRKNSLMDKFYGKNADKTLYYAPFAKFDDLFDFLKKNNAHKNLKKIYFLYFAMRIKWIWNIYDDEQAETAINIVKNILKHTGYNPEKNSFFALINKMNLQQIRDFIKTKSIFTIALGIEK